jgi:hypothetical protein
MLPWLGCSPLAETVQRAVSSLREQPGSGAAHGMLHVPRQLFKGLGASCGASTSSSLQN